MLKKNNVVDDVLKNVWTKFKKNDKPYYTIITLIIILYFHSKIPNEVEEDETTKFHVCFLPQGKYLIQQLMLSNIKNVLTKILPKYSIKIKVSDVALN
jgi:hypothetical protein